MSLALLLLGVAVVGAVVAVAVGRLPAGMPPPVGSSPHRPLPLRELAAEDLDDVRFSLAVRGYRQDEVDGVLDRLRTELAERDQRLAELGALVAAGPARREPLTETRADPEHTDGVTHPTRTEGY